MSKVGNIKRDIKKSAQKLISETSLIAFVKIFGVNKHKIQRLVWVILALVSCISSSRFIAGNVEEYYEYPTITNFNRFHEKEPEFPMVTFCHADRDYVCQFNGKKYENKVRRDKVCVITNRGRNFQTYERPIMKAENPGYKHGLYLNMTFATSDILLFINNRYVTYDKDKAINISATSLVVSRVLDYKLKYPYSNCKTGYTFELGLEDHFNQSLYPYFQSEYLCQFEKFFDAINRSKEYFQKYNKCIRINGPDLQWLVTRPIHYYILRFIKIFQINTKYWVRINFARTFAL